MAINVNYSNYGEGELISQIKFDIPSDSTKQIQLDVLVGSVDVNVLDNTVGSEQRVHFTLTKDSTKELIEILTAIAKQLP